MNSDDYWRIVHTAAHTFKSMRSALSKNFKSGAADY